MDLKLWWVKQKCYHFKKKKQLCANLCSDFYPSRQLWLFRQKPESLDPSAKYHSLTSGLGNNYTQPLKVQQVTRCFFVVVFFKNVSYVKKNNLFKTAKWYVVLSHLQMDITFETSESLYIKLLQLESDTRKKLAETQAAGPSLKTWRSWMIHIPHWKKEDAIFFFPPAACRKIYTRWTYLHFLCNLKI